MNQIEKAQVLGFPQLTYAYQRRVFAEAIRLGWKGVEPSVLGNCTSEAALDESLDFLLEAEFVKEVEANL